MTFLKLGNDAIMFGNKELCGHCKKQDLVLKKHFKSGHYIYKKVSPGKRLKNGLLIKAIPTWYIPVKNGMGYLHEGLITDKIKLNKLIKQKPKKRKFGFGADMVPEIGTLAKDGKNFPNGQGFNLAESWSQEITKKWGDPTLSGTLGREFGPGPGKVDQIYSNGYFNDIRMARPGGDLDTALNTNRSCNIYNPNPSPQGGNRDPATYTVGMIYDSKNPQITSFGRNKKSKKTKKPKKEKKKKETVEMYQSYIDNEAFKKGTLVRCMGTTPQKSLGGLSCDTYNNYSKNYKELVPVWLEKIKQLKSKGNKFHFGNLYQQMGPVPARNYLLNADTFNNLYAGGGQGEPARPLKGENNKLYINSSNVYNPVKSVTSFGITRPKRHLKKEIKAKKNKKKVVEFVKPHEVKQKKQKIKAGPGKTLVIKGGKVKVV